MCALALLMAIVSVANAQLGNRGRNLPTQEDAAFYKSDAERSQVLADKARRNDSTTDNGATTI